MMKIKLTDIKDRTNWAYLDQNPEYANQLVATLNQVDGFSPNWLKFYTDSDYWTYDYWTSPHYEIKKDTFVIGSDQMRIRSTNRDDLLNLKYYQQLSDLANNCQIKKGWWTYFPQHQVIKYNIINIKLTKPIDQYNQKQINAMGKLMTDVHHLIFKDDEFDWDQFDEQWKQRFGQNWIRWIRSVGIVFDINDFTNPKILVRWRDENDDNRYENDLLKNVLKADAPLLKLLNESDFKTHFSTLSIKSK